MKMITSLILLLAVIRANCWDISNYGTIPPDSEIDGSIASVWTYGQHRCIGVLITPMVVLTSMHCIERYDKDDMTVYLGTHLPNSGFLRSVQAIIPPDHLFTHYNVSMLILTSGGQYGVHKTCKKCKRQSNVLMNEVSVATVIPHLEVTQIKPNCCIVHWEAKGEEMSVKVKPTEVVVTDDCKKTSIYQSFDICTKPGDVKCQAHDGAVLFCNSKLAGILRYVDCNASIPAFFTGNDWAVIGWFNNHISRHAGNIGKSSASLHKRISNICVATAIPWYLLR